MNSYPDKHLPERPQSWNNVLGPFVRKSDIEASGIDTSTGILLETFDGTEVCPKFQFDKDEDGTLRVNPDIALAWSLLKTLQVDQLGESQWSKAGMLAQTRPEYNGHSWADVLKDAETDKQQKLSVIAEIVGDADYAARLLGVDLIDPRTILPE